QRVANRVERSQAHPTRAWWESPRRPPAQRCKTFVRSASASVHLQRHAAGENDQRAAPRPRTLGTSCRAADFPPPPQSMGGFGGPMEIMLILSLFGAVAMTLVVPAVRGLPR